MVVFTVVLLVGLLSETGRLAQEPGGMIDGKSRDARLCEREVVGAEIMAGFRRPSGAISRSTRFAICCASGQTVVRSAPVRTMSLARPHGKSASKFRASAVFAGGTLSILF